MTPESVARDLYRWNARLIWLHLSLFVTCFGLVAVIFIWQASLSRNQQAQILGLGMVAAFIVALALEHHFKQKRLPLYNYLARRDPAEFSAEELMLLFRAYRLRTRVHVREHDLLVVRYLRHYVEHHACGPLTGVAKELAKWMWHYRLQYKYLDPRIDLSWLALAAGRPSGQVK